MSLCIRENREERGIFSHARLVSIFSESSYFSCRSTDVRGLLKGKSCYRAGGMNAVHIQHCRPRSTHLTCCHLCIERI